MRKIYEIFQVLNIQKRMASAENICKNMIFDRGLGDLNDSALI